MLLSKQLHVTKLADEWRGVYSPFGHGMAFLTEEVWNHIERGEFNAVDQAIVDYLIKNHMVVNVGFEEEWIRNNRDDGEVKLNSMYLVVTQNCNFDCKYCAVIRNVDSRGRLHETMGIEVGRQALVLFERVLQKGQPRDARVTFYGGEPMLNQRLIFDLVPRIRSLTYPTQEKPIEIVMITNGYIYNPAITNLFKEHGVGVCISLDGKKIHQDVTRVTRTKRDSTFAQVVKHFKMYQKAGLSMGISTALGRHNAFDLQEICEFYACLGADFVEFQIPYQVANESNEFWVSTEEISRGLMEAYRLLKSHGIIEGTTYRRLRDFSNGWTHLRDCGASGSQLVVAPDGSIGPCHSLVGTRAFFCDNVMNGACDPSLLVNFSEWARRYPMNMKICEKCPYISLCGGGCIYNSFVSSGSIWEKDPQVCAYMREMVDWILHEVWRDTCEQEEGDGNIA